MISDSCCLSHLFQHFLSHSCTLVEWVCVTNRESHSLFILISDFYNYLPGSTSLGESNNPSAPQLWGLFPTNQQRRVNLYDFTWLYYINDSPDRNIGVLWNTKDSPDRNIRVQYRWIHSLVTNTSTLPLKSRGSLSIYTSFRLDSYLLGPTSPGESNNPSAPQLWGLFPPMNKEG